MNLNLNIFENFISNKKLSKIESKILDNFEKWKLEYIKQKIGNLETKEIITGRRFKKTKYYFKYIEQFVDEDTGEVVDIERWELYKINDNIVDKYGKIIDLQRVAKKLGI